MSWLTDLIKAMTNKPTPTPAPVAPTLSGTVSYIDAKQNCSAIGDGITDDTAALQTAINTAFNNVVKTSEAQAYGQKSLFVPGGSYKITQPLSIINGFGVKLFGAGKYSTRIFNPNGGGVFVTNGCAFSQFEDMTLGGGNKGEVVFDLDWNKTGTMLANNTFRNVVFDAAGTGIRIGNSQYMGSENAFYGCRWSNMTGDGLQVCNYNALNNWVFGGEFMGCATGIHVKAGGVPIIHGVAFELQSGQDIYIENTANDCYSISGCRSESTNFVNSSLAAGKIDGCTHWGSANGFFLNTGVQWTVSGCFSDKGQLIAKTGAIILNSAWNRTDWVNPGYPSHVIEMLNQVGGAWTTGTPTMHVFGQTKGGVYTAGIPT